MRKVPDAFLFAARIEVDERDFLGRKHLGDRAPRTNVVTEVVILAAEQVRAEKSCALRIVNITQDFRVYILALEGEQIFDEAARTFGAESNALIKIAEHISRARLLASELSLAFNLFKGVVRETKDRLSKGFVDGLLFGD